jgi:hypothetical protein
LGEGIFGKGRNGTILKNNHEGRVKSPIRGLLAAKTFKLGVTNGPENMTKMGRSGKRS